MDSAPGQPKTKPPWYKWGAKPHAGRRSQAAESLGILERYSFLKAYIVGLANQANTSTKTRKANQRNYVTNCVTIAGQKVSPLSWTRRLKALSEIKLKHKIV